MKENEVKKALEQIQPEPGARERMYANILKKAAQQAPEQAESKPKKGLSRPAVWRWCAVAACLVLLVAAIAVPKLGGGPEQDFVLAGSPYEDVAGPEGFEKLDLSIDAPEQAQDIAYCIVNGSIARVTFSSQGHRYTYEAARLEENFSGVLEEATERRAVEGREDITLERLTSGAWRACWRKGEVRYYLTNFDGASEEDIIKIIRLL